MKMKSSQEIMQEVNKEIMQGQIFSTPIATTRARLECPCYCKNKGAVCFLDCSLVNYGRDCRNNTVVDTAYGLKDGVIEELRTLAE
jgi:hypothetical protein